VVKRVRNEEFQVLKIEKPAILDVIGSEKKMNNKLATIQWCIGNNDDVNVVHDNISLLLLLLSPP